MSAEIKGIKPTNPRCPNGVGFSFFKRIRVAEMCYKRNRTMRQLARHLKISEQTVYYWNQGRVCPRLPMLIALSRYFDCRYEELIEEHDMPAWRHPKWMGCVDQMLNGLFGV